MLTHLILLKSNIIRMETYSNCINRCLRYPKKVKSFLKVNSINTSNLKTSNDIRKIMLTLNPPSKANFIMRPKKDIGTVNLKHTNRANINKPNVAKSIVGKKVINERKN